jgi:plastocyanin
LSAGLAAAAVAFPAAASARTVTVYAGGPPKWAGGLQQKTGAGIDNFLINKVVIHVGDSVRWNGASLAGGFHSVDIPARHGADLPLLTPTGKTAIENDAAGNPFWFSGKLPQLGFDPALFTRIGGTTYTGSARIDSGLPLGPPKDFVVKFTKPGTFNYFCDVHYGMGGQIVVKNKHARVPSNKQNATTLAKEERNFAKEAKLVAKDKVAADTVSLGKSGTGGLELFAMFPSTLKIKVGTTVRFVMSSHTREVHTASFGPAPYRNTLADSFHSPSGIPDPAGLYPSDPPGSITLNASSHGNGFASTGALDQDKATPLPAVGAIKFTQAGTYNYQCLIHPFMRGRIVVTP